jgi:cyclic pyranopterin phosphate synthase
MSQQLSHFDESGASRMVDTSDKPITMRAACASAHVDMKPETVQLILDRQVAKGDVFEVARLAGIMAAKRTSELIPLCHPLGLTSVSVDFEVEGSSTIQITATAKVHARTGVEMEALCAAAVAALTIYDMCKSVDRSIVIREIRLEQKSGGVHGDWRRDASSTATAPPI